MRKEEEEESLMDKDKGRKEKGVLWKGMLFGLIIWRIWKIILSSRIHSCGGQTSGNFGHKEKESILSVAAPLPSTKN